MEGSFAISISASMSQFELAEVVHEHRSACRELQRKLVEIGVKPSVPFDVEAVEADLGPDLVQKVNSLHAAIDVRVSEYSGLHIKVESSSRAALVDRFGAKRIIPANRKASENAAKALGLTSAHEWGHTIFRDVSWHLRTLLALHAD